MVNVYKSFVSTNSSKERKEYLKALLQNKNIRELVSYIYNPKIGFNSQVAFTKKQVQSLCSKCKYSGEFRPNVIKEVFNYLISIKSPKQRKETITKILPNKLTKEELQFLLSLINKDIGVSYKVLAELIDELPYFPFQLAQPIHKVVKKIEKVEEFIIQPKYDGIRIHYNPQTNEWYTRNQEILTSKERPNLKLLEEQFTDLLNKYTELQNYIFDGELFAGNWNDTMTLVSSEVEVENPEKLLFIVYDLIDRESYENYQPKSGKTQIVDRRTQLDRVKVVTELFNYDQEQKLYHLTDNIKFAPITITNKSELDSDTSLNNLLSHYLSEGYEGLMLKVVNAPYVDNRKEHWIKVKPEKELECVVLDVIEGDGKHQGSLGALLVKTVVKGKEVVFRVGSGFTDTQRQELWEKQSELIGKIVDVKYQELTKDNIPRFPVFVRIREDKKEPNFGS